MNYIIGEKIQVLADVSFAAENNSIIEEQLKNIKININFANQLPIETIAESFNSKKRIFVYTHFLDIFFEKIFPSLKNNFVLISHNSDHNVSLKYYHMYGQSKSK
jgi:hypothetical protein